MGPSRGLNLSTVNLSICQLPKLLLPSLHLAICFQDNLAVTSLPSSQLDARQANYAAPRNASLSLACSVSLWPLSYSPLVSTFKPGSPVLQAHRVLA